VVLFAGAGREELRRAWLEAWRKHREGRPLEPLEAQLADVIVAHPEYHALLEAGPGATGREWTPEGGETNPFLHMGLHMAVREGVATDRPPGLRHAFRTLAAAAGSAHDAEHRLLDCLAETLWEAQRDRRAPDEAAFLERVRRLPGCR
jgi:hypothetical protein